LILENVKCYQTNPELETTMIVLSDTLKNESGFLLYFYSMNLEIKIRSRVYGLCFFFFTQGYAFLLLKSTHDINHKS
jgi:hypothetical protein